MGRAACIVTSAASELNSNCSYRHGNVVEMPHRVRLTTRQHSQQNSFSDTCKGDVTTLKRPYLSFPYISLVAVLRVMLKGC